MLDSESLKYALLGSVSVFSLLTSQSLNENSKFTLFSNTFLYAGPEKTLKTYSCFGPVYNLCESLTLEDCKN